MNELISVIIPNFNRDQLIEKAIDSILNQTYQNFEIIVVDDNSEDKSKEVISKYMELDSRVKGYFLKENRGANYCRNKGVKISRGKFLAFLDSDDQFVKEKLEIQMKTYEENFKENNLGIIFSAHEINQEKTPATDILVQLRDVMFRNDLGGFSTIFLPKKIFNEVGGLDETMKSCQDWDLYVKILNNYNGYFISIKLIEYYIQNDSISNNLGKVIQGHHIIMNKIKDINLKENLYDKTVLNSEHSLLLGDIYRRFDDYISARNHYKTSLIDNFTLRGVYKYVTSLFGKRFYSYLNSIRNNV